MEIKLSVMVGTLQLTARSEQALPDQARNHAKPCEIKQIYHVLQSDDAENLTINLKKHDFQRALIKPMENELFRDCADLTINGVQRRDTVGRNWKMYKSMQIITLQECPGACMAPADVTWASHPVGDRNYPNQWFSCVPKPRNWRKRCDITYNICAIHTRYSI